MIRACAILLRLFLVVVILPAPLVAHTDTFLGVSESGAIIGLPDEFGPVSIRVIRYADPEATNDRPQVEVVMAGTRRVLGVCLSSLFMQPPTQELRAHASWYHDSDTLPPYLIVDIPWKLDPGEPWRFEGYSLMFNLESGELREVRRHQLESSLESTVLSSQEACAAVGREAGPAA